MVVVKRNRHLLSASISATPQVVLVDVPSAAATCSVKDASENMEHSEEEVVPPLAVASVAPMKAVGLGLLQACTSAVELNPPERQLLACLLYLHQLSLRLFLPFSVLSILLAGIDDNDSSLFHSGSQEPSRTMRMAGTDQRHATATHERETDLEVANLVALLELEMEVAKLRADREESASFARSACTAKTKPLNRC
jgi:hypothetical protein